MLRVWRRRLLKICVLAGASLAYGNTYQFVTPAGSTDGTGEPVDVVTEITTGTNLITVSISNLQANPNSTAELISDLTFNLTTLDSNTASVSFSSGSSGERIDGSGWSNTPTNDPSDTPAWTVATSGATTTQITLSALTAGANLIIGSPSSSGSYTAAGFSLTNCNDCPYILDDATFTISLSGITSSTAINEADTVVSFNTTSGHNVDMDFTTPEPASADLVLLGVVLLFLFRRQVSASLLRRPHVRAADQPLQP